MPNQSIFKISLGHAIRNFKLDLLVKENWNLVEKCKFLAIECEIGVVMSSHKIFQFFENFDPLPFFIEFKICKVGRMCIHMNVMENSKGGSHLDLV